MESLPLVSSARRGTISDPTMVPVRVRAGGYEKYSRGGKAGESERVEVVRKKLMLSSRMTPVEEGDLSFA